MSVCSRSQTGSGVSNPSRSTSVAAGALPPSSNPPATTRPVKMPAKATIKERRSATLIGPRPPCPRTYHAVCKLDRFIRSAFRCIVFSAKLLRQSQAAEETCCGLSSTGSLEFAKGIRKLLSNREGQDAAKRIRIGRLGGMGRMSVAHHRSVDPQNPYNRSSLLNQTTFVDLLFFSNSCVRVGAQHIDEVQQ